MDLSLDFDGQKASDKRGGKVCKGTEVRTQRKLFQESQTANLLPLKLPVPPSLTKTNTLPIICQEASPVSITVYVWMDHVEMNTQRYIFLGSFLFCFPNLPNGQRGLGTSSF